NIFRQGRSDKIKNLKNMPPEILKPEIEEGEEGPESELNQVIEKERKDIQKDFYIDERTGEVLTEQEKKERIEKGLER
ncbi:MAG: hypothetical protein AAB772_02030, partial [Patescibacteria group bacterium]